LQHPNLPTPHVCSAGACTKCRYLRVYASLCVNLRFLRLPASNIPPPTTAGMYAECMRNVWKRYHFPMGKVSGRYAEGMKTLSTPYHNSITNLSRVYPKYTWDVGYIHQVLKDTPNQRPTNPLPEPTSQCRRSTSLVPQSNDHLTHCRKQRHGTPRSHARFHPLNN
jgi:hypothetical protein